MVRKEFTQDLGFDLRIYYYVRNPLAAELYFIILQQMNYNRGGRMAGYDKEFQKDIRDIYEFYVDDETRGRIELMSISIFLL